MRGPAFVLALVALGAGCELVIAHDVTVDPTCCTSGSGGGATSSGPTASSGSSVSSGSVGSSGTGGSTSCAPGVSSPCYDGPPGTEAVGICHAGTHVCGQDGASFGVCMNEQVPEPEDYTTPQDENCDGVANAATTWVDTVSDTAGAAGASQVIFGVASDTTGAVFVVGGFAGSIKIGTTTLMATSINDDVFVAKLTAAGTPIWAKQFGNGAKATAVTVSGNGNVIFSGSSAMPIDFGASTGPVPAGVFVVELGTTDGSTIWSSGCGSSTSPTSSSMGVDSQGNVTIGGNFAGSLNCGSAALTVSTNSVPGMFVAQFTAGGAPGWVKKFDSQPTPNVENLAAIAVEPGGSIWLTGTLQGTVNFGGPTFTDPPGGSGAGNIFLVKLGSDGAHVNSQAFGDNAAQGGTAVAVDAQGNAFITGYNQGTVNFGGTAQVAIGAQDVVLAEFDSNGFYVWDASHGGAQGRSSGLTLGIEPTGDLVVAGSLQGRLDLGGGSFLSDNSNYAFLARYDKKGTFIWSDYYGGNKSSFDATVKPHGIALTSAKNIVLGGEYYQAADFGLGTTPPSSGTDAFVMQVAP